MSFWESFKIKAIKKVGVDNFAFFLWFCGGIFWVIAFIYPNENNIEPMATNLSRGISLFIYNSLCLYWKSLSGIQSLTKIDEKYYTNRSINFLIIRHLILSVHGIVFAQCQFYLPAPIIYTIYFAGPLFIILMQYFIYQSKVTIEQSKGILFAIIGVLLTTHGMYLTNWIFNREEQFQSDFTNYKTNNPFIRSLAGLILIITTFAWAYSILIVREIQKAPHYAANIYFGEILVMVTTFVYCINGKCIFNYNISLYFWCFIYHGIPAILGQIAYIQASMLTKKIGIMTMIGLLGLVFTYLLSVLRYGQAVDPFCLIGTLLVIFGVSRIVLGKQKQ